MSTTKSRHCIYNSFGEEWDPDAEPERRETFIECMDARAVENELEPATNWLLAHISKDKVPKGDDYDKMTAIEKAKYSKLGSDCLGILVRYDHLAALSSHR
jgi:hypothetical protein